MIKKFIKFIDKKVDLRKFIKFGITGILNTAIDFGVFTFCNEILNFDPVISNPIGQTLATINSFFINKNWTFEKRKNYNVKEVLKFLIVNLISISLTTLGMYIFNDKLGINKYVCKIPIFFITICINYFGNKLFVFK
ncbi:MAG: GtrA family protein [Oscillospiraceae bacterium]|nr:GtrA family protein [Oscillospiraceae bacterium]